MQTKNPETTPAPSKHRAVALLTILSLVSMLTVFVLALHSLSRTELASSSHYSNGIEADILSNTAINLVIHQLRSATEGRDGSAENLVWASQPGMVRTWDSRGSFHRAFKLYSDDELVARDAIAAAADQDDLSNWSDKKNRAIWVDLNDPVRRGTTTHYPIVDPRAKMEGEGQTVEGFDYDLGSISRGPLDNELPMPVKWIYTLADGSLGTLNSQNDFVPLADGTKMPTKDNRIVGRIAFWADDESSKININTASEPTFWDTPRVAAHQERNFGKFQPGAQEYQRYPGHPATTALSSVLAPNRNLRWTDKEVLYDAVPRIAPGGSKGGSVGVAFLKFHKSAKEVVIDRDRLYANVDEFLFRPDRTLNRFPMNILSRPEPGVSAQANLLSRTRFFLTAHSRSPEVNAFNLPRVSIWPTHLERTHPETGEPLRSAFDEAIRFCATLGELRDSPESNDLNRFHFHFQREDSDSPTHDWERIRRNREVYDYLAELLRRKVPGYGRSFRDKYGEDTEQLLTQIFDYIRSTNLYDDNLDRLYYTAKEWRNGEVAQFTDGRKQTEVKKGSKTIEVDSAINIWPGHGQVAPIQISENNTMGFGRFYTVSEAGFVFICNADAGDKEPYNDEDKLTGGYMNSNNPQYNFSIEEALEKGEKSLQAMFLMDLFSPSLGWTQLRDDFTIEVDFESNFSLAGESLELGVDGDVYQSYWSAMGDGASCARWGGNIGFWSMLRDRRSPERTPIPIDRGYVGEDGSKIRAYPFISVPVTVDGTGDTIEFSGGKLVISIFSGHERDEDPDSRPLLVQKIHLDFPQATIPMPQLVDYRYNGSSTGKDWDRNNVNSWDENEEIKRTSYLTSVIDPSVWWALPAYGPGGGTAVLENRRGAPSRNSASRNLRGVNWHRDRRGRQIYLETGEPKHSIGESYAGRLSRMGSPTWTFVPGRQNGRGKKPGYDVVRTLVPAHGDYRLIAAQHEVYEDEFTPNRHYHSQRYLAHSFSGRFTNVGGVHGYDLGRGIVQKAKYNTSRWPDVPATDVNYNPRDRRREYADHPNQHGDFDNGMGMVIDGAYINKPDEGNTRVNNRKSTNQIPKGALTGTFTWGDQHHFTGDGSTSDVEGGKGTPYYSGETQQEASTAAFFSPNRQIPSPGMFGSLPTGVKRGLPWQTLLFRPQEKHPGADSPPDHLLLDLFWMPVVEPYSISEPFSTAGKVNLNYQMQPFTYIERSTALRATLKSERLLIVPTEKAAQYKNPNGAKNMGNVRFPIDPDATLEQFEERFEKNELFKTASEICDVHLVPKREERSLDARRNAFKLEDMVSGEFWERNALTGDNSRERPYTNLYPRLTTQSNTFRIHYRVEAVRQDSMSPKYPGKLRSEEEYGTFDPDVDTAIAESRGSTLIERRIDPNHPLVPDYATKPNSTPQLDEFFSFRIISKRRFSP
ncbi:MAG: hypothetical protein ACI8UO_001900 [Verrucomicrobiales bacterium]|jgi:uncharacterized protein (TIGR02600 family)